MAKTPLRVLLAMGAATSLGTGEIKCFSHDDELAKPVQVSGSESGVDSDSSPTSDELGMSSSGNASAFVPAKACSRAGLARFNVANFAYLVDCGCKEAAGRVCTVPIGTTVVWTFADSEEHNITSVASRFGMSPDNLSGTFEHTFTSPGRFEYGCTIHPSDMSGYSIVVESFEP